MKDWKYILASGSPRRRELLAGLELPFEIRLLPDIDETYPDGLSAEEIVTYIAEQKAEAYVPTLADNELVITADTIVYLDGKVLGKPADEAEACRMLHTLSGRTHLVVTGVTLRTLRHSHSFACVSKVSFANLTDQEIQHYVHTYHPTDKAGAYGVQEWIGYIGVERIEGSYYNVMGLPVQRLYNELKQFIQNI